jgi:hypothetical protein
VPATPTPCWRACRTPFATSPGWCAQDAELARLREQADQFDQLKAIIARNG